MAEVTICTAKDTDKYIVSGLPEIPGLDYTVTVTARNSAGEKSATKSFSTPPAEVTAPAMPVLE